MEVLTNNLSEYTFTCYIFSIITNSNNMKNFTAPFAFIFVYLLGVCVMALVLAWPTQWLWNICLVPAIDAVNPITFWQSLGLIILASLLFNSTTPKRIKKD